MNDELPPEADRLDGTPHPRDTARLLGQDAAERAFLEAYTQNRLHHGWAITGPKGIGKATLAWKLAAFLISQPVEADDGLFGAPPPPETLDLPPDHPVWRRLRAGSEPGLFLLRRPFDEKAGRL